MASWGGYFVYYRICYSVFSALHLGLVLWYQFLIPDYRLYSPGWIMPALTAPFLVLSLIVIAVSVYKYFFHLSGIAVFTNIAPSDELFRKGLHRYVRHPLYSGTLLLVWSLFSLFPLLSNLLACTIISLYTIIGIRWEEKKLRETFGLDYKKYADQTPMLFPRMKNRRKKFYI
ncbi:MAG: isoprenylcysteine carboxylmethyltransferase family protein [Flavitalea sp.]